MKKIYILILLIFFLCGCNATVNLEIDEKTIDEQITIDTSTDTTYPKNIWKTSFRDYIPVYNDVVIADTEPDEPVSGVKYYEKTLKEVGSSYIFEYKYKYNLENYHKARSLKNGFKSYDILKNEKEGTITLSSDKTGLLYFDKYPSLENVTINIHSKYKVIASNSDSNNNGTYTWKLSKSNNKNIYMVIQYKEVIQKPGDNNQNNNNNNDNNQNTDNNESKKQSEVEEFISKHPVLIGILAIVSFIFVVLLIRKIATPK